MSTAERIIIARDPADAVAGQEPVGWAIGELRAALADAGLPADETAGPEPGALNVIVAGPAQPLAQRVLDQAGAALPDAPEAFALVPETADDRDVLLAAGRDVRGLVYAVLELAHRVAHADDPRAALRLERPIVERPANAIRSVARLFTSDVEDMGWFHDRDFWRRYLTDLATQRWNRFTLTLGLGYNFPRNVPDAYFYFAYPFLVAVPGYAVRVPGVTDEERARNLETLRFIGAETVRRGLHFQLALWTHAYEWIDSPQANYVVEGLTPETHAAYCRDALRTLIEAVPAIQGITFRVHGESGIPEGSYDFWRTVFDGIVQAGRRLEIDMHAKGLDEETIEMALATGLSVTVSGKYWAEHMGLPYQQASIRALEQARTPGRWEQSHMALSAGSRRFTRYGYGDFLREDRRHGFLQRIWPGTQRLLLWGDPAMAAGYGRTASFAGALGLEYCEPLSFKGRMGSGRPGGRDGYADPALRPAEDWQKYRYTYRLFGRLLYNPATDPDGWRRFLRRAFGPAAAACEAALGHASRILLLVTTAYHPSASNNRYWPEIYTTMPIVAEEGHPYGDTPSPKRFGTVSSLDPVLFSTVEEFADEVVRDEPGPRYSPLDVGRWLDGLAASAEQHLADAEQRAPDTGASAFRRWAIDVRLQAGLGRFFAAKLRAGVGWALYLRTGDAGYGQEALAAYHAARAHWAEVAEAGRVYRDDLTFGREPWLRGHWADRLPAIDADLANMAVALDTAGAGAASAGRLAALGQERPHIAVQHTAPASFRPGEPLRLELAVGEDVRARLHYRHANQAELHQVSELEGTGERLVATIPAKYTDAPYALTYFFELRTGDRAWLWPGFDDDLSNQPYFLVRQVSPLKRHV